MVHIIEPMKIGRPMEFDPEHALDAAMDVFWCKGYEAASLTELLKAMSLSKSSLYQTFGGKQALFQKCLARYQDRFARELTVQLEHAPSGLQFIRGVFEWVASTAQEPAGAKGCLVANSATEFGQRDPVFAKPIAQGLKRLEAIFKAAVKRAQQEGDVAAGTDRNALAGYLLSAITGLRTLIKSGLDKRSAGAMVPLIMKAVR